LKKGNVAFKKGSLTGCGERAHPYARGKSIPGRAVSKEGTDFAEGANRNLQKKRVIACYLTGEGKSQPRDRGGPPLEKNMQAGVRCRITFLSRKIEARSR